MVVVTCADTRSTGRYFQVMAHTAVDKILPGPELDALTAEKGFWWMNIHKHQASLVGKSYCILPIGSPNSTIICLVAYQ